jgi:hypothetical protein
MKSDLSNVKIGDKIWTIQSGWEEVIAINSVDKYPIETKSNCFTIDGLRWRGDKYPSAFLEYPFKEQSIEKDTLVYYRDHEEQEWSIGYYSHFSGEQHFIFDNSKKSIESKKGDILPWKIVTTENPLL